MTDLWMERPPVERAVRSTPQRLRRAVPAVIALAVVVFLAVTAGSLGVFVPNLQISLTTSRATTGGLLDTEFDLRNDGELSTRVERIIVHSEALGQSEIAVFSDGVEVELPEMLDAGESLEVRILFDSYDCDAAAGASPKIDVRARPLLPSSVKRGLRVRDLSGVQWLLAATDEACP
jgi:hypothetical protein